MLSEALDTIPCTRLLNDTNAETHPLNDITDQNVCDAPCYFSKVSKELYLWEYMIDERVKDQINEMTLMKACMWLEDQWHY